MSFGSRTRASALIAIFAFAGVATLTAQVARKTLSNDPVGLSSNTLSVTLSSTTTTGTRPTLATQLRPAELWRKVKITHTSSVRLPVRLGVDCGFASKATLITPGRSSTIASCRSVAPARCGSI